MIHSFFLVRIVAFTAAFLLVVGGAFGCHASPPEADSEEPSEVVATEEIAPVQSESAESWLGLLEASATKTRTLKARARLTSRGALFDDETVRFGDLVYAGHDGDTPARFAVRFNRLKMDGFVDPIDQAYIFDGRWLLDLNGDDRTATRRELMPEGQQANLNVGEGPFPLPLDLNKDRVLQRFIVELMPAAEDDPQAGSQASEAGSVHLQLIPRDHTEIDAEQIDLWFDRATRLPLRAVTLQEDGDTTILDLFQNSPDAELRPGVFNTAFPEDGQWETQTVPLD